MPNSTRKPCAAKVKINNAVPMPKRVIMFRPDFHSDRIVRRVIMEEIYANTIQIAVSEKNKFNDFKLT